MELAIVPDMFKEKTVAVVGLGRSGLAAARALSDGGAQVVVWDDNEPARADAGLKGYRVASPEEASFETLVLSPGVPLTHPEPHAAAKRARAAGVPILGDVELLYRSHPEARYLGITGTNGKSTTTALLGHILTQCGRRAEVGGNLGTPAMDLAPLGNDGTYVLEMSSYQLDLIDTVQFDTAILLNVTPDHLDRHGGMDGYINAKCRIFTGSPDTGVAIVGIDTPECRAVADDLRAKGRRVIPISTHQTVSGGIYVMDGHLIDDMECDAKPVLALSDVPSLPGLHNAQNIAAAYVAARLEDLDTGAISAAAKTFPGLAHRLETVAEQDGVRFVNDSKATNAEAAATALASFDRIYWIAGGREKDGGYSQMSPHLPAIEKAFLIGEAAGSLQQAIGGSVPTEICGTLDRAVERATTLAMTEGARGSVILLSPACASFDQFPNFEKRGEAFTDSVNRILKERKAAQS